MLISYSCKENDSAKPNLYAAEILSQLNVADTFLFDFMQKDGTLDTSSLEYLRWQEKWLDLPSLHKGFDSIQIRIWYGCFLTGDRLVALIHNGQRWKSEISELIFHGGGEQGPSRYPDSVTRVTHFKNPESGWISFIDSLFTLKILTLPNDYDIPGFIPNYPMDGCGIAFEISTRNAYRCYSYANPDLYDHWQVKNVLRIINLLSSEFNITEWPERSPTKEDEEKRKSKSDSIITIRELTLPEDTLNSAKKKE